MSERPHGKPKGDKPREKHVEKQQYGHEGERRYEHDGLVAAQPQGSSMTHYVTPSQFMYGASTNTSAYSHPPAPFADPDYAHFMAQHGGQVAPHVVYEAKRATRQMAHYFDVDQYKREADAGTAPTPPPAAAKPKPTKKQVEQFKKRKEERKRIRNRWLFE